MVRTKLYAVENGQAQRSRIYPKLSNQDGDKITYIYMLKINVNKKSIL